MFNLFDYNFRNIKFVLKAFFINIFKKILSFFNFVKIFIFRRSLKIRLRVNIAVFGLVAISFFCFTFLYSPNDFPVGAIVIIEEGLSLEQIANSLQEKKVIKSSYAFSGLVRTFLSDKGVMAGSYFFEDKCSILKVIERVTIADYGIEPTKVTFVEGSTIYDVANIMKKKFSRFDTEEFLEIAQGEEGYLFPDTYYFLPNVTPQAVVTTMKDNFIKRISEISDKLAKFDKDMDDVVIMASLLEKEARTLETKRMIAGILWRRIEIGMPLQVDAVFPYIIGKNTYQVSLEDLKVDSPYNTYINKGLPIGPIANPSLWSLLAAVTPIKSNYLFYLSDRSGNMHYGIDFEQHKSNRYLYLN